MSRALLIAVVFGALHWASPARANCAMPVDYAVSVEGNTVTVCPENFGARGCPDQGLLRKSTAGEVVTLRDCDPDKKCFVDECVPPGTYQYGYAKPFACASSSCGTYYYQQGSVTAALSPECQRSEGRSGPQPFSGQVPWKDERQLCGYGAAPSLSSCAAVPAPAAIFALNALVLAAGFGWHARRRRRR